MEVSGGSRKLGTGGGRNGGGGLRQNQVLAVCTERSTGKSSAPPPKSAPGSIFLYKDSKRTNDTAR